MMNSFVKDSHLLWPSETIPTVQPTTPLPLALASIGRSFGIGVICDPITHFVGLLDSVVAESLLNERRVDVATQVAGDYATKSSLVISAGARIADLKKIYDGHPSTFLPVCDETGVFLGLLRTSDLKNVET